VSDEAEDGERLEEHEERVGGDEVRADEWQQRGRLHHRGEERVQRHQPPRHREDEERGEDAGEGGREAQRPLVPAEELHAGGEGPVGERRLGEVRDVARQPRREPVAALDHVPGDRRVAPLVRLEEAAGAGQA
jgi:hypothetical protein